MTLKIKNWKSFQHYKDRSPPWIKLHKSLLDDYEFQCLPVASKALAPMLWLLASDYHEASIPLSITAISFRLRMTEEDLLNALKPLVDAGFVMFDSTMLAKCYQLDTPETETETENYISTSSRFQEFWERYPASRRKAAKTKCQQVWKKKKLDLVADTIFSHLDFMSEDYTKESCRFCPAPLAYLNGEKWDGYEIAATQTPVFDF